MGIDIESFSSTSPTDPSDPRHSHTASVAGFWIKKGTYYDWLNCLHHDPSSTVTPTSFNDPSTPKHLLLFFWKATTSSNKNSLSSLGQLTMALFFFKRRIKTSKHAGHPVASMFHMSPILFPSFPFPRCYHPKPSPAGVASLIREDSAATALSEVAGNCPLN